MALETLSARGVKKLSGWEMAGECRRDGTHCSLPIAIWNFILGVAPSQVLEHQWYPLSSTMWWKPSELEPLGCPLSWLHTFLFSPACGMPRLTHLLKPIEPSRWSRRSMSGEWLAKLRISWSWWFYAHRLCSICVLNQHACQELKFHGVTMAGPTASLEKAGKGGRYEGNLARDVYRQLGKGAAWLIYNIYM